MSDTPRARRPRDRVAAALAGLLTAFAVSAIAQPPTEEEDPKGGLKKRVRVDDDPPPPKPKVDPAALGTPPDVRLDELTRGADETPHAALKELFTKHAVPFDRLTTKSAVTRIKPIPVARGERFPVQFGIQEILRDGQPGEPQGVNTADVRKVDYFEEIVLGEANVVLAAKPLGTGAGPAGWTAVEQLNAAERLIAAGLRYHDYARERNIRKGRGWDDFRKPLADRLREVRLLQLKNAVTVGDSQRVNATGTKLMLAYPNDTTVAAEVASARVLEAKRLLASDKHFDHVKARELLDEFEANYPGTGGDAVRALRTELTRLARESFERAKQRKAANELAAAGDALKRAVALDPAIPGAREMQRELRTGYQTLYVGVRQYPEQMSPATARLDSEKQVVELLFEGLLAEVPDDGQGPRFRAANAQGLPAVIPGGREFLLRTFDRDFTGRYGFESHDVVGTLKMLGAQPHTWNAYGLPWFDDLPTPKDNATVRMGFKLGHPDPRTLLTFKLLPARWLANAGKAADDPGFAEKPSGTGPYRLHANPKAEGGAPREMVFLDNPVYGRRDRTDQPFIREVRLLEVAKVHNVIEAFQQGSLHILPDVPTAELDKYRGALADKADVYTAANNRRIHMLAVNHRRPALQSRALRQGISLAIDREAILSDVYRAGKGEFHRALAGPFPPQSWATAKAAGGQVVPLVNRDLALTRFRTYLLDPGAKSELTLLHASDDPLAKGACEKIKAQIEGLFPKEAAARKITIALEAVPLRDLLLRVEDEHRYDLAYLPFDYPDDWYPFALGAMLDPSAAERGGRNWFGFNRRGGIGASDEDTRLGQLLSELRAFREFSSLTAKSTEVQRLFNECVPFVPLWQLDRHTLFHKTVKVSTDDSDAVADPGVLNPTTLFQGVARWRLE